MTAATLLVELLTEELPPKALPRLGETFATKIAEGLKARGLAPADAGFRTFASPRRLAVTVAQVASEAAAKEVTEKLMPVSVALDAEGRPTPALLKKMEAKGIPANAASAFERRMDGKAEALFHTAMVPGAKLADVLAGIVQDAIKALPIPKVMRWGDGDATFVRPVHKLTFLHGADVVPGRVLRVHYEDLVREPEAQAWARQHCVTRGARAGGGTPELKQRATADLLGFLAAHDFASPWTNRKFPAIEES